MNQKKITDILDTNRVVYSLSEPLAPYTTYKIGGVADILVVAEDRDTITRVYTLCQQTDTPLVILGGGSNTLISDKGIRGVVIINKTKNWNILDEESVQTKNLTEEEADQYSLWIQPRHSETGDDFYTFKDLDYTEKGKTKYVRFDSGVVVSYAIALMLKNNLTGLQWFAGIPGTMGGALYNNIHGGTKHFSDVFVEATIIDKEGIRSVGREFFGFGYDQSILREESEVVVLDVTLRLYCEEDVAKAKYVANEWARRKRIQPRVSSGCIFQNVSNEEAQKTGLESPSVGYIVDKKLHLGGTVFGGAMISDKHSAFIENIDDATSDDVLHLIKLIKRKVNDEFGIVLHPEIKLLGFDESDLQGIY